MLRAPLAVVTAPSATTDSTRSACALNGSAPFVPTTQRAAAVFWRWLTVSGLAVGVRTR